MIVKYKDKSWCYEDEKDFERLKLFVLQNEPQLKQKQWILTYIDADGDQIIIGDEEQFENTIDYYKSCQKHFVILIKQMWWKTKRIYSKSKFIKGLITRKQSEKQELQFSDSDSSSDGDYVQVDFRPGSMFYQDPDTVSAPGSLSNSKSQQEQTTGKFLRTISIEKKQRKEFDKGKQKSYDNVVIGAKIENTIQLGEDKKSLKKQNKDVEKMIDKIDIIKIE